MRLNVPKYRDNFGMENVKSIMLKSENKDCFGVFVLEKSKDKCKGTLCLFDTQKQDLKFLIDDFVKIQQFDISNVCTEIDFDQNFFEMLDYACVVLDSQNNCLMCGNFQSKFDDKCLNKFLIAVEKNDQLNHYKQMCKNICNDYEQKQSNLFLSDVVCELLELFRVGKPELSLEKFVKDSKWVRISLKNSVIALGVQTKNGKVFSVGVAYPVFEKNDKPSDVDKNFTYFAQNPLYPDGFGWWIVMQSATDGSVVKSN